MTTVQELIDALNQVEDKSKEISIELYFAGRWNCHDLHIVYECEEYPYIGVVLSGDIDNEQHETRTVYHIDDENRGDY